MRVRCRPWCQRPGPTLATNASMESAAPGDQAYAYSVGIVSSDRAAFDDISIFRRDFL